MLTYDDLDHFDERTMAGLFDPTVVAREQASAAQRRKRILACLEFCRATPSDQLPADGLQMARRFLRRALRRQQRSRTAPGEEMLTHLGGALLALGDAGWRPADPPEVAVLRHAVEREIENAARSRVGSGVASAVPELLESLASGDFEISPGSDLAALEEASRRFNGNADVELELRFDGVDAFSIARVRLAIACGIWRWSGREAGSVVFDDDEECIEFPANDDLVPVLLAGLSVDGGRAVTLWAAAVQALPAEVEGAE